MAAARTWESEIARRKAIKKAKTVSKSVFLNAFFIIIAFLTLLPIIYAFGISFGESNSLLSSSLSLFPERWTLENYISLFADYDILTWFGNTLLLAVSTVVLVLAISIPAAYAFSRFRFHMRGATIRFLIILNAFPSVLSLYSVYTLVRELGLSNSIGGLLLVYVGTMAIFGLYNLKGYFDTIPYEIEEAARMDGCSTFGVITKILLPLARPALAVTGVMVLIYVWNEYIFAVTFISNPDFYTLASGLYGLQAQESTGSWPVFFAASLVVSAPILLVFMLAQRHMVSGLSAGGVKE